MTPHIVIAWAKAALVVGVVALIWLLLLSMLIVVVRAWSQDFFG